MALLDEVYKEASKTAVLDGRPELVQAGANANELVIPKMTMDGLADYSRNGGYVGGAMNLTNETVTCNFDRGRMFVVDHMDNADTAGVAFGMLAGEFIRTKVVAELDAFRFATYAGAAGVGSGSGTLNDGAAVVAALREAINAMDADEVPMEDRVLFITSGLLGKVEDLDTTKSREVLRRFSDVVAVPQTRFYTAIHQNSGTVVQKGGETASDETADCIALTTPERPALMPAFRPAMALVPIDFRLVAVRLRETAFFTLEETVLPAPLMSYVVRSPASPAIAVVPEGFRASLPRAALMAVSRLVARVAASVEKS